MNYKETTNCPGCGKQYKIIKKRMVDTKQDIELSICNNSDCNLYIKDIWTTKK